jgi:ATP-dependent DNA helicase RecQ
VNLHGALVESLRTGVAPLEVPEKPATTWGWEYGFWRFLKALHDEAGVGPDHAVLLRQAIRWWNGTQLIVDRVAPSVRDAATFAGIEVGPGQLRVRPFAPVWLTQEGIEPERGIDGRPDGRLLDESITAEPWLTALANHSHWRSLAQKEACWLALQAPPGSTTLVGLPTGAGKSLVFQLLARFASGLTVVVVPTVALAIDHATNCRAVLSHLSHIVPRHYASGGSKDLAAAVREEVRTRKCRLLFTSPEACVSGGLRSVLEEAAREGWLENLVVDEAHIVESWGTHFRVDFQILSAFTRQWRAATDGRLRAFLLSATFSEDCRETLKELFPEGPGGWHELVCQRLRPEMNYFARPFDLELERSQAIEDCVRYLPRPAILYATEVEEANNVYTFITQQLGLRRAGCFHGDTSSAERTRLLDAWRRDEIDVMVATSAFGLGVDKSDVRSVIHACLPETMDRYYQEVGRGGRDGASAICILLPTRGDERIARRLAPTLLGDEKLRLRWNALWDSAREAPSSSGHIFSVPTDTRHHGLIGARSFDENIRWNKRLLLLLMRAGCLRLHDLSDKDPELADLNGEVQEWITFELKFPPQTDIADLVRERRDFEVNRSFRALEHLIKYVQKELSICRCLRGQYGNDVQRACGSCFACRSGLVQAVPVSPLEFGPSSRTDPRLSMVLSVPDPIRPEGRDELVLLVRRVITSTLVRRFACVPDEYPQVRGLFDEAFGERSRELYRIDSVAENRLFRIDAKESLICFHLKRYATELEVMNRYGREVVHWIGSNVQIYDANRRVPGILAGASLYASPSLWLMSA